MDDRCTEEASAARILVTVVLYKRLPAESQTVQGLLQTFARYPELRDALPVLIWDNSPAPFADTQSLSPFLYRHTQKNLGVSGAYNRAMDIAEAMGCQWLLLFDQDTTVPVDFLPRIFKLGRRLSKQPEIAAVVPVLMDGDRVLSPVKVLFKRFQPMQRPCPEGVYPGQVSAANSGALMRIDALRQVGGYNEDFWLDFSDYVVFHLLHEQGKQVYIASDLLLKHRITIVDFENSMSPERYASFIAAEGAYWDAYGTIAERFFQTLRIIERAIRQKRKLKNPAYARITFANFFKRLCHRRKERLRWWKLQTLQRDMPK